MHQKIFRMKRENYSTMAVCPFVHVHDNLSRNEEISIYIFK